MPGTIIEIDDSCPTWWCVHCKHFNREVPMLCAAFPVAPGIPKQFMPPGSIQKHDKPYPGDHGIQFEPKETP